MAKSQPNPQLPDRSPVPFVDAVGKPLAIGDLVAYLPTGNHDRLYFGVIESTEVVFGGIGHYGSPNGFVPHNEYVTKMRILKTEADGTPIMETKWSESAHAFLPTGKQERTGKLKHRSLNMIRVS